MRDPATVRAFLLLAPVLLGAILWFVRRPRYRARLGVLFALLWNLVTLLAVNVFAVRVGWWSFALEGGEFLGVPVDLWLGWSMLWTVLATLAMPSWHVLGVALIAGLIGFWLDWILMPLADPWVRLHPTWLIGEFVSLVVCLLPAVFFARWTDENRQLSARVLMHVLVFCIVMLWIIPSAVLEQTGGDWSAIGARPLWLNIVLAQAVLIAAVVGLSAVQEFCERGGGTPLPLDPPTRLVSSGPYAYVANPMQVSIVVVLALWGVFLGSWVVAGASAMVIVFGIGLANWISAEQLEHRFAAAWSEYRHTVRPWIPSWRPRAPAGQRPARLYLDLGCRPCREVGQWLERRGPRGLEIIDAVNHPSGNLVRMTYEADGPPGAADAANGVVALSRALDHIHLGWAYLGWGLRLPVIRTVIQLLTDAVGGGPRCALGAERRGG